VAGIIQIKLHHSFVLSREHGLVASLANSVEHQLRARADA